MSSESVPLFSRSKIWIEDSQGNVIFGSGRLKILKAIQQYGSINAAAKELNMGYRSVWARMNATEKRLGQKLLAKQTGGSTGGGSQLTPLAESLIETFGNVQRKIENETDTLFKDELSGQLTLDNQYKKNTGKHK